ncbi:hypothetical protein [Actinophytocola sp. KF-1]
MLISTGAAVTVLIRILAPNSAQDRLDTVRTGLAIGAGIGALITLALALRRQQATEHDATERRLTELYVKAVDQLGSDKPAVRQGGLYALERVAQDNPWGSGRTGSTALRSSQEDAVGSIDASARSRSCRISGTSA